MRVLAGAGTGKTTTLSARVAWLLAHGTAPERILLLTFTRRAARQMLHRTAALLARTDAEAQSAARVVGGTFHAVAHRTLRRHAPALGLAEGFSVLDPADAADVIDMVREEAGHATTTGRRFPRKALLADLYSRAVNTGRPISEVVADVAPWANDLAEPIGDICRGYVARKRAGSLVDFDDLLLLWRAAAADERLGPRLAGAYDHVLVDEYQDVNGLQVDVLRALRRDDRRITVVGDDAQAVYSFRAAEPRHILDFHLAFPGAHTVVLTANYRSTQPILDTANALGSEADEGFSAVLRAAKGASGERPKLVHCADEDSQCVHACEQILAHREEGIALRDQAVLVRAARHSNLLELELAARRIPYVKYGGLRFTEAAHVKDLLAAFRVADNAADVLAWFRVLQLLDGVGPVIARRALAALGLTGVDIAHAENGETMSRWPVAAAELPAACRPAAGALADAMAGREGEGVAAHAERLRAAMAPIVQRAYPDGAARLVDLEALVVAAAKVSRLSDVAADFALEPPRSTSDLAGPPSIDEDWLTISTVHSAKGLEWDVVHILHATDGMIPSDMSLSTPSGLEEERRVFYVGLTRARRSLLVYLPLRYHHRPHGRDDAHGWAQPSRFLTEKVRATFDDVHESFDILEAAGAGAAGDGLARLSETLESLWS